MNTYPQPSKGIPFLVGAGMRSRAIRPFAALLIALSFATMVAAQTTVVNTGTGNWNGSVWSPAGTPNGSTVTIQKESASTITLTQNIAGGVTVASIVYAAGANNNWSISPSTNGITLQNSLGDASIVNNSSQSAARIQLPSGSGFVITLADDLAITNTANTNTTGSILVSTALAGSGNVTINNFSNTLNSGHIRMESNGATYTGTTTIASGITTFTLPTSFGSSANQIVLGKLGSGSATLVSNRTTGTVNLANAITVAAGSGGTLRLGAMPSATGAMSTTFSGAVTLNGDVVVVSENQSTGSSTVAFTNVISGSGALTVTGNANGVTQLFGVNTFSGDTRIASGRLELEANEGSHSYALQGSTVNLDAGDAGSLGFGGSSSTAITAATFGGLKGSRNLVLQNSNTTPAAVALQVGANNASTTYNGVLSGAGSLTKIGSGTLTLGGVNTYSGGTTISQGTLTLSSAGRIAGGATIGENGTLTGSGAVQGPVMIHGTISAGEEVGALTIGDATLFAGGHFSLGLASIGSGGAASAGADWDQLFVDGVLDLTNLSETNRFIVDLVSYASPLALGAIASFDPGTNYVWESVILFDSVQGTFSNNLFTFQTADFQNALSPDGQFSFVMRENSIDLVYTAVPEPSTYAAIAGALALGLAVLNRRRRLS